jgi:hypothetical protein
MSAPKNLPKMFDGAVMNKKPNLNRWFSTVFCERMLKQGIEPDFSHANYDYAANMPEYDDYDFPIEKIFNVPLRKFPFGIYTCEYYNIENQEQGGFRFDSNGWIIIFVYKSKRFKTITIPKSISEKFYDIEDYLEENFKGQPLPPKIYQKCLMMLL